VYAPNSHGESGAFFAECFDKIDEFIETSCSDLQCPVEIIIAGDFNFVFNPITESLNRNSSNQERSLSNLVTQELTARSCIRVPLIGTELGQILIML